MSVKSERADNSEAQDVEATKAQVSHLSKSCLEDQRSQCKENTSDLGLLRHTDQAQANGLSVFST